MGDHHIGKLYRIEAEIKAKSPEQKQALRQQHAQPLLEQLKSWLDKSALQVPPKSAIGKAIAYSLRQWPKLIRYLDDGRLTIDNNRAERAIKPFVIRRKNWIFANTSNGAQASVVLYSIIETALCRIRHSAVYAERRTMPNRRISRLYLSEFAH